jgi:hypothetical protein
MRSGLLLISCLSLALALLGAGCGSACQDLANQVCDCQPTRSKQERCERSIDSAFRNDEPSSGEDDRCQEILDSGTCTCEALAAGNLAACGLANDATWVWQD